MWDAETYELLKTICFLKNVFVEKNGKIIPHPCTFKDKFHKELSELSEIDYVEVSSDNKKILSLDRKGIIRIWDIIKNKEELKILPILKDTVYK